MTENDNTELSRRYYSAEIFIWLSGLTLIFCSMFPASPVLVISSFGIAVRDRQTLFQILDLLIVLAIVYLTFEWMSSAKDSRVKISSRARFTATCFIAISAIWSSYLDLAKGTKYSAVGFQWYILYIATGYLIGNSFWKLALYSLFIRTEAESKQIHMPRIPSVTYFIWTIYIPLFAFFVGGYYLVRWTSPPAAKNLGTTLTAVTFIVTITASALRLRFCGDARSEDSFGMRVQKLKNGMTSVDYAIRLRFSNRLQPLEQYTQGASRSPQLRQKEIRARIREELVGIDESPSGFQVETLDELQCSRDFKDGNKENRKARNIVVRVALRDSGKKTIAVNLVPEDPAKKRLKLELPLDRVNYHVDSYMLRAERRKEIQFRELLSYALNRTASEMAIVPSKFPLLRAAELGNTDSAKALIEEGSDANLIGEFGWTPLLAATANDFPKVMRVLLEGGANPDIGNLTHVTPLMYAAHYGNIDACRLLIEYGAKLNLQDVRGNSALMVAVKSGQFSIVDILLRQGADRNISNNESESALDMAHKLGHGKIAKRLRK